MVARLHYRGAAPGRASLFRVRIVAHQSLMHFSLYPMAAMYKIVEEPMPVPDEGVSQELRDFLCAVRLIHSDAAC